MKSTTGLATIAVLILIVGGFVFWNSSTKSYEGDVSGNVEGGVQKIVLGMKNYNYYPNTIKVKAGQPVEITLDSSVRGCYRSFVIKDLGVSMYSKTPEVKINFTPTKKGTFRFACSMGMGTGTIIVE